MKTKLIFASLAIAMCCFFYSCSDIFETDLSKKWVYVVIPHDFDTLDIQTPTLKWEEVKGAEYYNLQISRTEPKFPYVIKEFIVDTNVRATQYTCSLKPGSYKWQIYAENGGSRTGLSEFHFLIDSTNDLAKQKVLLISPKDNTTTDTLEVKFEWGSLNAASYYKFQIFPTTGNTNVALYAANVSASTAKTVTTSVTFPSKKATYTWSVLAQNATSSSAPAPSLKISIDTTKAIIGIPVVKSPVNDTSILTTYVPLTWNVVPNATAYHIQVSQNILTPGMDTTTTAAFYNYYHAIGGVKYYWRVKAIQNSSEGSYSNWYLFRRK